MEEFKLKDLVVEYFAEQTKILNIEKLKNDFLEFYLRMKQLDAEMTAKMKQVDIMYAEVEAGFSRNARDRSDYLVHYEHLSTDVQSTVGDFRQNMVEFSDKLDKLSTCILSIVNEDEAAELGRQRGEALTLKYDDVPGTEFQSNVTSPVALVSQYLPRRHSENGRFKNVADLANEI